MKTFRKLIFTSLLFGLSLLVLNSCFGDDSETYKDAYGYVSSSSAGVVFINTSAGYSITWDGIEDELQAGSCVKVSYKTDYSLLNAAYKASDVSYTKLAASGLSANTPVAVNDTISALALMMYNNYSWFADNWFVAIQTLSHPGQTFTPQFYYSVSNVENFNEDNDSIIVDVRAVLSGTVTGTTTNVTVQEFAVDLSPIRAILASRSLNNVPVYFRYYTSKTGKPSYSSVGYLSTASSSNN